MFCLHVSLHAEDTSEENVVGRVAGRARAGRHGAVILERQQKQPEKAGH